MSEYPQASQASWPQFGEASVPPPVPIPFALSARNTPLPWGNYRQNYTPFPIAVANNVGAFGGPQPRPPQQGNAYEANDPPHCRGILSGILKKVLSERMAHPESEVIAYHKESGDHGKMKITVTFETYGEM
ncbi:hypothetical protein BGY98DRAFT_1100492 [Russula aff. rugulosa BPL654]|nr:hypothetical protein BGY98DRAFT_1100492 [Russula aff. rugulosa BPL654]